MKQPWMRAYKSLYFCICCVSLFFLSAVPVKAAYIDPSVMTYAIQAVSGIVIALSSVIGIYFSRIRRKMNLNTVRKGEEESDALYFKDPASDTVVRTEVSDTPDNKGVQKASGRKLSLPAELCLSFAISFLTCFYEPLFIYFTNIDEFRYQFTDIFPWIVLLFVIVWLVIFLILHLSRKLSPKLFFLVFFIAASLYFAMYVQGTILIKDLPPTDGAKVEWPDYGPQKLQSLILFGSCFLINAVLGFVLKTKKYYKTVSIGSMFISAILFCTLIVSCIQNNGLQRRVNQPRVYTNGMNLVSSDTNFVILLIDAVDSRNFRNLLETDDPEYREYFEDFTYFPDTLAGYPYTRNSLPFMFSGIWYENELDYQEYATNALNSSKLFSELRKRKYSIGMYDDELYYGDPKFYEDIPNISSGSYGISNPKSLMMNELRMAFFMFMPYQLKHLEPYALYNLIYDNSTDKYNWENIAFWNYMHENELEHTDEKRFLYYHLEGAHAPANYDKEMNVHGNDEVTYDDDVEACMTLSNHFLEKLKAAGAYDNSVIMILGDHGANPNGAEYGRQNPLLLIKGVNEHHPFEISDSAVSYADLSDAYIQLLDDSPAGTLFPFTQDRVRRYLLHGPAKQEILTEYELVNAPASDTDALKKTGNVYKLKQ